MKTVIRLLAICLLGFYLASCSRVYAPAAVSNDIYHTEKPFYSSKDTALQKATYGSIYVAENGGFNNDENNRLITFQYYQSYNNKRWSASYGGYVYTGIYKVNLNPQTPTLYNFQGYNNSYHGLGIKADAYLSQNVGFINYRYLGIEISVSKEWGDYHDALNSVNGSYNHIGDEIIFIDPVLLVAFGLSSEMEFKVNDKIKFGFGLSMGSYITEIPITYFQGRLFGSYNDISILVNSTSAISSSSDRAEGYSISIIYRLKHSKNKRQPSRSTPRF